jgi:hypothetical protein
VLSRGNVLTHVFELRDEVSVFLSLQEHAQSLANECGAGLPYLSDIFSRLKELNRKMLGNIENMLSYN